MHEFSDSYELFESLNRLDLLKASPFLWWPNSGSFEVVLAAILVQNSRWEKATQSLQNLEAAGLFSIDRWQNTTLESIEMLIAPSGLYRIKARYLKVLIKNIYQDFGDFASFTDEVDREWLLGQKGIGFESADAILCYACKREVMVVDRYTQKFLGYLGRVYDTYEELQSFLQSGLEAHRNRLELDYGLTLYEALARFHGMFVEAGKRKLKML